METSYRDTENYGVRCGGCGEFVFTPVIVTVTDEGTSIEHDEDDPSFPYFCPVCDSELTY